MKKIITILTLGLCVTLGQSQILDVFQNKEYGVSSYVLSADIKKDYSPSELEIIHDKNKDKNEVWTKIEDQFFEIATATVNNEVEFFMLNNKALKYQTQIEKLNRLQGNNARYSTNPKFTSIDINLISVLNNCGIYSIHFNFELNTGQRYGLEEIPIAKYYIADFGKNTINEFEDTPTQLQQTKLKELTLSKFKTLYLLKTQKLDLDNLERIEDTKKNSGYGSGIESKLYYSEALVYPYMSGLIVEFPENSNSSEIFNNESFRVYIKNAEVNELLSVYPVFKPAFKNELGQSSSSQMEQLHNDINFDLTRFQHAPKELEMLDILNFDKDVYTMEIKSYQLNDTNRRPMGTKKVFFNDFQKVDKIEHYGENKKLIREVIYNYDNDNYLKSINTSDREKSLKLYYYKQGYLDYIENYELEIQSSYEGDYVDLEMLQEHYIYSNNYQYKLRLNLVGEFNHRGYNQYRYVEKNEFCTNSFCILTDDAQNIIGVKQKKHGLIDVLTNTNNQPVECYRDNDRYQYFFTYDELGRIKSLNTKSDSKNSNTIEYQYQLDNKKALTIRDTRHSYANETVVEYVYEFEFMKH